MGTRHSDIKVKHRTAKADLLLTRPIFAIPFFLCIMLLIFYLTFGPVGTRLSEVLSFCIDWAAGQLSCILLDAGVNPAFYSLITDGVCTGIGSILSFLPVIGILFFCLSILENCGYMARIALVMDQFLPKIGLPGSAIIPLTLGFGCSVPAIMAAGVLPSKRDRRLTTLLIPFMSCSAKLPLYIMFTAAFFPAHPVFIMFLLYVTGILTAVLYGLILKNTLYCGSPSPLSRFLPPYRFPSPKKVGTQVWDNTKGFVKKAFTVILAASVIIWFLEHFDMSFNLVDNSENSILAAMGKCASPIFLPLGFGDWRAATALITGISAKEAIVSTLAVLTGTVHGSAPSAVLTEMFTPRAALAFLVFCLLYTPCITALTTAGRQTGGWYHTLTAALFQCMIAWIVSFIIYKIGGFFI